jgi:hypothetical protein
MLEDMAMRGLRSHTQRDYVRFVRSFAAFLGRSAQSVDPDQPFRPIVITNSGDPDHGVHLA